jgi:hypothetical protein
MDGMTLRAFPGQQHDAHIEAHLMQGMSPILQANPMAAVTLQKHILEHVKLKAEEDVEVDLFKAYGMDPGNMVSDLQREAMVAIKVAQYLQEVKAKQAEMMGPQDDPLVKLKEQELQQSAQRDQQRAQIDQQRLQVEQADKAEQDRIDRERIASNEEIAQYRGNIAMQKMNQPKGMPNAS